MSFAMIALLLAGIGLFMFGMSTFEETIRTALGSNVKETIKRSAGGIFKSMSIGIGATTILQSSLIVIMLMLGFVGAGILNLTQGIGIVLGSNIGTTLPLWPIALGSELNLKIITMPIIALGGILLIAAKRIKWLQIAARLLIGFGLLFLGLSFMKESVDGLAATISLADMNLGLFKSILIGLIITVAMQTSTGSIMLILAALQSGMIDFDIALGMMIGANLGSAVSTFLIGYLGAEKGQKIKKVIAATHLLANVLMMIVILILFKPILFVMHLAGLMERPAIAIATFHTIYNIIGVSVLLPFVQKYVNFLHRKGFTDEQANEQLFAIEQTNTTLPEEYLASMKTDTKYFFGKLISFITTMIDASHTDATALIEEYGKLRQEMDEWFALVMDYRPDSITPQQLIQLEHYQLVASTCFDAVKQLKDIVVDYYSLRQQSTSFVKVYLEKFDDKLDEFVQLAQQLLDDRRSNSLQDKITRMTKELSLDDEIFLRDIRTSIARYNDKKEYQAFLSQLIKVNRSLVISGESLLKAGSYYLSMDTKLH